VSGEREQLKAASKRRVRTPEGPGILEVPTLIQLPPSAHPSGSNPSAAAAASEELARARGLALDEAMFGAVETVRASVAFTLESKLKVSCPSRACL
jgi:hypothetical protein